jgi:ankyrin repeat protein
MNDRLGRDELFYRIGDEEESPELLETISRLEKVDFRDAEGVTYLHIAALNHKPKIIKLLLEKGADPNSKDYRGRFAVIWALGTKNEKNPEILRLFLEYGLDLDIKKENDGLTIRETFLSFENPKLNEVIQEFENR